MSESFRDRLDEIARRATTDADVQTIEAALAALRSDLNAWSDELSELRLPAKPDDDQKSMLEQTERALAHFMEAAALVSAYLGDHQHPHLERARELTRLAHNDLLEVQMDSQANIEHLLGRGR